MHLFSKFLLCLTFLSTTIHTMNRPCPPINKRSYKTAPYKNPLFNGILSNDIAAIKQYIDAGADLNVCEKNNTLLSLAVSADQLDIAQLLLEAHCLVDKKAYKETPLHIAIKKDNAAMAQLLLNYNANVNSTATCEWTPLHFAVDKGNLTIASSLIEKNALLVNRADKFGVPPLHLAINKRYNAMVELLLSKGANVNSVDLNGSTPLFIAAGTGNTYIVSLLLNDAQQYDRLLHIAAEYGHIELTEFLLDKNVAINYIDQDGKTPLHKAAANGHIKVTELLLTKGADINQVNQEGNTPLHLAICKNHSAIVKLLVQYNVKITPQNIDMAIEKEFYYIAQYLTEMISISGSNVVKR